MKLTRRSRDDASRPDGQADHPDSPAAQPRPPRGAPVSAFAGVMDGRSLWLAVPATPGALALRDVVTGDVTALASDLPDDDPAFTAVRVDLGELGVADEATYEVVLVPTGNRAPKRVWTAPLPRTVVPTIDGHRWAVRRDDDGWLRVLRHLVPRAVELRGVRLTPEGVRLDVEPAEPLVLRGGPDDAESEIAALDGDLLTVAVVAGLAPQRVRVTTASGLPVVRRDNDLANPGRAVPLPELHEPSSAIGETHGAVRVRLLWRGGDLHAEIVDEEAGA